MKASVIQRKPSICFVCPYCYPLFNPQNRTIFGGGEVRLSQIAKEVAKRGNFKVSAIVADHGQLHREFIDGIELISWKDWSYWHVPELVQLSAAAGTTTQIPEVTTNEKIGEINRLRIYPIFSSIKDNAKRIYKGIIPWKARLVVHATVAGLRDGFRYLKQRWSDTSRLEIQDIKTFMKIFRECIQRVAFTVRSAYDHIGDEPVYRSSIKAFAEANADIYVFQGNNYISAWLANFCKKRKRIYVMLSSSDIDYSPDIKANPNGTNVYMNPNRLRLYAIQNADCHIVQSEQQAVLAKFYGIDPVVIPNPISLDIDYPRNNESNNILWVGNTDERVKRPSLMLDIIRNFQNYHFVMILTPVTPGDFERWLEKSQDIPNLTSLSGIPLNEIEEFYSNAKIFVNTSAFEGFPNTFLQAGKYGVPIVSLKVDPNHLFSKHGCGILCNDDIHLFIEGIQKLMDNNELYNKISINIHNYVSKYHDQNIIIPQYERFFLSKVKSY